MGADEEIAAAADDHRIRAVVAEDAGTSTFADATSVLCTSAEAIMLPAVWLTFTSADLLSDATPKRSSYLHWLRLSGGGIHSRGPSSHLPVGGSVDRQEHHCQVNGVVDTQLLGPSGGTEIPCDGQRPANVT
jgi:hypothetical protein